MGRDIVKCVPILPPIFGRAHTAAADTTGHELAACVAAAARTHGPHMNVQRGALGCNQGSPTLSSCAPGSATAQRTAACALSSSVPPSFSQRRDVNDDQVAKSGRRAAYHCDPLDVQRAWVHIRDPPTRCDTSLRHRHNRCPLGFRPETVPASEHHAWF